VLGALGFLRSAFFSFHGLDIDEAVFCSIFPDHLRFSGELRELLVHPVREIDAVVVRFYLLLAESIHIDCIRNRAGGYTSSKFPGMLFDPGLGFGQLLLQVHNGSFR